MTPARILGCALLVLACATPGPTARPAHDLRDRLAGVEVGQTRDAVQRALGTLPVLRPGRPDAPFPTPLRALEWGSPRGERVRVEVYVVAARPAEGCPDVHFDDRPLAFLDDRLVAKDWDTLEWRWRDWGGDLARLRALQDRFACEEAPSDSRGAGSR